MSKKTTRLKMTGPTVRTKSDAESAMSSLRELHLQLTQINLDRESAVKLIDESFNNKSVVIQAKMDSIVHSLGEWAEDNKSEFGKAKSLELAHGTIGWQINPPSVKQLSGWKLDESIEAISKIPEWAEKYIRNKPELNKAALLNDRESLTDKETPNPELLRSVGLKIDQQEPFYAQPKIEDVNPK